MLARRSPRNPRVPQEKMSFTADILLVECLANASAASAPDMPEPLSVTRWTLTRPLPEVIRSRLRSHPRRSSSPPVPCDRCRAFNHSTSRDMIDGFLVEREWSCFRKNSNHQAPRFLARPDIIELLEGLERCHCLTVSSDFNSSMTGLQEFRHPGIDKEHLCIMLTVLPLWGDFCIIP